MNTTLYNHKRIGNDDKPLIPNIIFKGLIWLCEHQFYEECEYIISNYSLAPSQKSIYEQADKISKTMRKFKG